MVSRLLIYSFQRVYAYRLGLGDIIEVDGTSSGTMGEGIVGDPPAPSWLSAAGHEGHAAEVFRALSCCIFFPILEAPVVRLLSFKVNQPFSEYLPSLLEDFFPIIFHYNSPTVYGAHRLSTTCFWGENTVLITTADSDSSSVAQPTLRTQTNEHTQHY